MQWVPASMARAGDELIGAMQAALEDEVTGRHLQTAGMMLLESQEMVSTLILLAQLARNPEQSVSAQMSTERFTLPSGQTKAYLQSVAESIRERDLALAKITGQYLEQWLEPLAIFNCLRLLSEAQKDKALREALASAYSAVRWNELEQFPSDLSDREYWQIMACLGPAETERLTAENPFTLDPEQPEFIRLLRLPVSYFDGEDEAKRRQYEREIRDYIRSLRPQKRPGRPRTVEPKQLSEKDQEALRASELDEAGISRLAIADALGIEYDRYDKQSRDRVRKTVQRRIQRGYELRDRGLG